MRYKTTDVCASYIDFEIDSEGRVRNVHFMGGCPGNRRAVSLLVEGMPATEVIDKLRGIPCRNGTSCADQLANALTEALRKNNILG